MKLEYKKSARVPEKKIRKISGRLQAEIRSMRSASKKKYEDDRAAINLCEDTETYKKVQRVVHQKKKLNPKLLIIIGIGGSNLGTIAIQEAVKGRWHNQLNQNMNIIYIDTVDADMVTDGLKIAEMMLKKKRNILINVISKSGTTTETIANLEVFIRLLKKYKKKYEQYIVVTTDKDSALWNLAKQKNFTLLSIPKKVGGRYSVFSPVGLFPLSLIGINTKKLLAGACTIKKQCLSTNISKNPAAISAILLYIQHKQKKDITNLFLFSNDLAGIGKWYRQLMGESIGKEYSKTNKQIFEGIVPIISIGSTDLHSMAQLFLGGPNNEFTTFIKLENVKTIRIPHYKEFNTLVKNIQGKSMQNIMNAILQGIQTAFKQKKRSFMTITLENKTEHSIGQFLQYKMMKMMYLGSLLNVNAFNQPNVEEYKKVTRKLLARQT